MNELEAMQVANFNTSEIYYVANSEKIVYLNGYLEWQHKYTQKVAEETGEDTYSLLEALRDRERFEKLNIKIDGKREQ